MRILKPGGYFVSIAGKLSTHPKEGVTQSFFINSDTNLSNEKEMDALNALIEGKAGKGAL